MRERTPAFLISPGCPEIGHAGTHRQAEWIDVAGHQWTRGTCLIFASFLLQAVSVDFQKQKVHFMDGSSQKYNQLLIAIGSQ